ncbi:MULTISPECIES: hypothetical protein [Lelliottia]|jgi:hypothetical protein|uniref:Uncharacterized protein n=1 Tax=Lelliottia aquatilis TaxID=2080838 RepID=A0ABX5A184_9ENTR|nr:MULTISPECIES: hypothetical protein [Lelliottia]ASV54506.1 hypothetical protein LJPFL01_1143 [Lelliottia jeotgali]NTZ46163.1 hypothetical protein [Lelliottia aquatilis]POZ17508.1 hypothetical protein C3Z09_07185 [Lelliottia aquatilis]POZ22777.1 hypothetical protein C3712_11485 [Lelliottia aquatilis]POZ25413.1 hypothetical protein C3708_12640 [Lelliottia sp. 7254-16]
MATIPALSYAQSEESFIQQLLNAPLPETVDLFEAADSCTTVVCVLVETLDINTRKALCERLLHSLNQLRDLCDKDLPPHLIEQLIAGEKISSNVPDLWQETATMVDYAQALTQAVEGGKLPSKVEKELTGLLHDMVWLLADFVKEPYITAH